MKSTVRLLAVAPLFVLIAAQPASRPATQAASRPGLGAGRDTPLGRFMQGYQQVLRTLSLTPEQQPAIRAALADLMQKVQAMGPELRNITPDERREKIRELLGDTSATIMDQLTDEQKAKFKQGVAELESRLRLGLGPDATSRPATRPAAASPAPGLAGRRGRGLPPGPNAPEGPDKPLAPAPAKPELEVGDDAPHLSAKRMDGSAVDVDNYKGRIVVVIFGSYTAPTFRDKAAGLSVVARDFTNRNVAFLTVYTAEAFPSGDKEIERNKRDKIAIPAHKTITDRRNAAKAAQSALKLETILLMDDLDDATAKAYGLTPNGVAIIGKDGKVAAIQRWMDPYALRAQLESLTRGGGASAP